MACVKTEIFFLFVYHYIEQKKTCVSPDMADTIIKKRFFPNE